jgi:hypothetical protein
MQIKITYQLARHVVTQRQQHRRYYVNRQLGLFDTWCRLKALSGYSSVIQGWQKQLSDSHGILDISTTVLYRRLQALRAEGWLDFYSDKIILISWAELHRRMGLKYDKQFFTHNLIQEKKQKFYWIYLAESQTNKARQAYMVAKQVNKNHSVKATVYNELVKDSSVDIALCESNPQYLCDKLQSLYKDGFINGGSEIYETLVRIRPFTSRSSTGMGKEYHGDITHTGKLEQHVKSRYSVLGAYIKQRMSSALVSQNVGVRTLESEARQRNPYCFVKWNKHNFTTFHAFCDEIEPAFQEAAELAEVPADLLAEFSGNGSPAFTTTNSGTGHGENGEFL